MHIYCGLTYCVLFCRFSEVGSRMLVVCVCAYALCCWHSLVFAIRCGLNVAAAAAAASMLLARVMHADAGAGKLTRTLCRTVAPRDRYLATHGTRCANPARKPSHTQRTVRCVRKCMSRGFRRILPHGFGCIIW